MLALAWANSPWGDPAGHDEAVVGVLAGSGLAALLGTAVFRVLGDRGSLCAPPGADEEAPALPPRSRSYEPAS